jgi:hypothetical protein
VPEFIVPGKIMGEFLEPAEAPFRSKKLVNKTQIIAVNHG